MVERREKFPRAFPWVIAAIAMMASFAGCSPKTDNDQKAASIAVSNVTLTAAQRLHIQLYTVTAVRFHKTVEATGTVDFDQDQATIVLAPFGGSVSKLLVSPGTRVKVGQPMADVDSPDLDAAISVYRKALATARTARKLARLDGELLKHQGVSQPEAEQAETDAANAEADRDAALQELRAMDVSSQAIKDLQEGRPMLHLEGVIRSPITGTVVERMITPGELLQAGTAPCFSVANLSRVWIMAHLFGSDIASVSVGDPAEVMTGIAATNFPGTVDNLGAEVDPDTQSVIARVVALNPGGILRKQMYVRVLIHAKRESTGLLVPVSAILRDSENLPFVYVVQPDGSFARRRVVLGNRVEDQYDIPGGLQVGDRIVVDGSIFLQFMQNQ